MFLLGLLFRVAIVAVPGNKLNAPWSGGGDAVTYVLLANNLSQGKGFSYALQPTALRAPGYPLLLAGLKWCFGNNFLIAVRWVQFFLGLATVYFCSRASSLAFGKEAGRATLLIGLFFPTLIFVTGEVLTECIGAFLTAGFLYLLVQVIQKARAAVLVEMGLLTGVAALFRFNMALLVFVGIWVALVVTNLSPCLATSGFDMFVGRHRDFTLADSKPTSLSWSGSLLDS